MTTSLDPLKAQSFPKTPPLPYWRRVFDLLLGRGWETASSDEEGEVSSGPSALEPSPDKVSAETLPVAPEKDENVESERQLAEEEKQKLLKQIRKYAS